MQMRKVETGRNWERNRERKEITKRSVEGIKSKKKGGMSGDCEYNCLTVRTMKPGPPKQILKYTR